MKHVANRRKAVSPSPKKSSSQPKNAGEKTSSGIAESSRKIPFKTLKANAKTIPVVLPSKKEVVGEDSKATISNGRKNVAAKTAPKISPVKSVKETQSKKTEIQKKQTVKNEVQAVKVEKVSVKKVISATKIVEKKPKDKLMAAAEKLPVVAPKTKSAATAKTSKIVQKTPNIKSLAVDRENRKTSEIKPLITIAKNNRTAKKLPPTAAENLQVSKANKKIASALKTKPEKTKAAAPVAIASREKAEIVELSVEAINLPVPKPKKKKVKPIGAAIFRGIKERYDFQVFPIDGEFDDAAAIFIISQRKVDKHKKAHHKMICIGQTDSVLNDLKKHRKGKCFKQHQANAISVLREEDERKRLKIASDLMSAHTIPCSHV